MASKRQLLLELLASDKTGPATKGAADNLDGVAVAAEEAAKATDKLGTQAEESKEEVERFGKSNKSAAEHAEALKHEIEATERELHQLAIAFAEAETAADRADYSKAIRKMQSDLRKLNNGKGLVEDLIPGADPVQVQTAAKNLDQLKQHITGLKTAFLSAGTVEGRSFLSKAIKDAEGELQSLEKFAQDVGPKIGKSFSEELSGLGEAAGPALVVGAVAAAPAIAAVISGAVVGGVGIGGIAGGLLLASKDPRVSSALDALKKETGDRLKDAATPFVPVALNGIHEIDAALQGINFKGLFSDAAKEAAPLIEGVVVAVEGLGHGITDLVHNAGPAVAAIGQGIGELGQTIGAGLAELSSNGKEGADALTNVFAIVNVGTEYVFGLLDVLTKVYGVMREGSNLLPGVADAFRAISDAGGSVGHLTKATTDQGAAAAKAATANKELAAAAEAAAAAARGEKGALDEVSNAIKAQTDPVFAVVNAQKELTTATDAYNGAVKKHGKNSEAAKLADQQLANAALDLEGNVGKLGSSFNGKLTPQMIATFKAAHLTDAQIKGLAAQFTAAKAKGDAFAKTYTATVNVKENFENTGKYVSSIQATGGFSFVGRAAGGPVRKGEPYVVGEHRPELFVPDSNGTIIPQVNQARGSAAGWGGGDHRLVIDVRGADTEFGRLISKLLRTDTGFADTVRKYVVG